MNRIKSLFKNNRGQSMVEFAIVLPVLLLVICGIVEFGRIYNAELVVTAAAREAVRSAIVAPTGQAQSEAQKAVSKFAESFPGTLNPPVLTPSTPVLGQQVTVKVSGKVDIFTGVIQGFFSKNAEYSDGKLVVSADCTMRN